MLQMHLHLYQIFPKTPVSQGPCGRKTEPLLTYSKGLSKEFFFPFHLLSEFISGKEFWGIETL